MQLLPVNFKRFMCLVIDSECSEGASKNPSGIDFINESTTVAIINDKSYICLSYEYYQLTRSQLRHARIFLTTD